MVIDQLRNYRRKDQKNKTSQFVRYLVIGDNFLAAKTYIDLCARYEREDVSLVSERVLTEDDLNILGPSQLRGVENLKVLKNLYPHMRLEDQKSQSVFFKEGEWRSFQGRSKSQACLFAEAFYIDPRQGHHSDIAIPGDELKVILERVQHHPLVSIRKIGDENNFLEDRTWEIETSDGMIFQCEYLIWAQNEKRFLDLFTGKEKLTNAFIEFYSEIGQIRSLLVRYTMQNGAPVDPNTYFIPLSYTHEWGHFVGEFKSNPDEKSCFFEAIHFIDEADTSEEEISKRISLLEKALEKIFPTVNFRNAARLLSLKSQAPCLNFDTGPTDQDLCELKKIALITPNAPLEADFDVEISEKKLSNIVRGLYSLHCFLRNL